METKTLSQFIQGTELTFLRLPNQPNYPKACNLIVGIPWDLSVTDHPGARYAPWAIRWESSRFMGDTPTHWIDTGNIALPIGNPQHAGQMIGSHYTELLQKGHHTLTIGGDHGISRPIIDAYQKKYPNMIVIHLDAHPDRTDPEYGHHHGTIFADFPEDKLYSFGLRYPNWKNSPPPSPDLLREIVGNRPYYLTVDIDVVDPSLAPGVSTPIPGGWTSRELLDLLSNLPKGLVGADIVECNPERDVNGITARLVSWCGAMMMKHFPHDFLGPSQVPSRS